MATLAQSFPPDIVYSVPYTTTPFVTESLKEVIKTLGAAIVLVLTLLLLVLIGDALRDALDPRKVLEGDLE